MDFEFEISLDCKGTLPLKQRNSLFHCRMCTKGWRKHLFALLSVLLPFSIIQMPGFFKNLLSLFHSYSFSLLLLKIYYYCSWRDNSVVMSACCPSRDLSIAPSTRIRWLRTTCNSRRVDQHHLLTLMGTALTCAYTHTHTHTYTC